MKGLTRIYFFNTEALEDKILFDRYYEQTSDFRRDKIDRMRYDRSKRLTLGGSIVIDRMVQPMGLREGEAHYTLGEDGKPYIEGVEQSFNISHSGVMVMGVVSDCEAGCDIEQIMTADPKVAERFFHIDEYRYITDCGNTTEQQSRFYTIWTMKESYTKAVGKGLHIPLDGFAIVEQAGSYTLVHRSIATDCKRYFLDSIELIEGYKSSICLGYGDNEDFVYRPSVEIIKL